MPVPTREELYHALCQRHGEELQAKISAASAAVCGLGGLGSNTAIHLARAGIGSLHIIDFDKVDISNLNRQQYCTSQLGEYKTDALCETLLKIAPYCEIRRDCVKLTAENIPELLSGDGIICEAFDRADQKAVLVNTVLERLPEKYIVSGSGMAGLSSANDIVTKRVMKRLYICGDGSSDISGGLGLISARVAVCAAHQAHMVLRIIAGEYDV